MRELNVLPDFSMAYLINYRVRNAKHSAKRLVGYLARKLTDLKNRSGRQFCLSILLAQIHAAFLQSISMVIGFVSRKKMIGANAFRHVAFVASVKAVWNRSIGQLIRKSVRQYGPPAGCPELTIAQRAGSFNAATSPQPAWAEFRAMCGYGTGFVYFRPKSLFDGIPPAPYLLNLAVRFIVSPASRLVTLVASAPTSWKFVQLFQFATARASLHGHNILRKNRCSLKEIAYVSAA